MKVSTIAVALCLALCVVGTVSQYDDFEYGYDEYYDEYNYGDWYDEEYAGEEGYDGYGGDYYDDYYDEEYGNYDDYGGDGEYDDYGYDGYDDYPQDYYMDYDYFDEVPDCEVDESGKVSLLGMNACDLKITGADKALNKLTNGMDGVYKVVGCHDGKPMYKRSDGKTNSDRLLWYSSLYKDWDFNEGSVVVESDILGYGGDGLAEERPQFVPGDKWNLLAEYSSNANDQMKDFVSVTLDIQCADGSVVTPTVAADNSTPQFGAHPLLTDEEWEAKYAQIYKKYSKKEPSISTGFVSMVVLAGIAIILGIPYLVYFRKNPRSKAYSLLNNSRKALSGHKL